MSAWDPDNGLGASEFGGDGRRKRTALQEAYQPDGDTEGASMEGLLPLAEQKEERRADDN